MSTTNELENPAMVYVNDYVRVHTDGVQFDGVVLGIDQHTHEALVHEYSAQGDPTARIHEVSIDGTTQHEAGRNL